LTTLLLIFAGISAISFGFFISALLRSEFTGWRQAQNRSRPAIYRCEWNFSGKMNWHHCADFHRMSCACKKPTRKSGP